MERDSNKAYQWKDQGRGQNLGPRHVKVSLAREAVIRNLWSNSNKYKPLHTYMLLVPEASRLLSSIRKVKAQSCRSSQKGWANDVVSILNRDILHLHRPVNGWDYHTLHDAIMNIHPKDEPNQQLFTSVHLHYSGNGFMFECASQRKDKAEQRINSLLPYLLHGWRSRTRLSIWKMFDPQYRARMSGTTWDSNLGEAISKTDTWMDEVESAHQTQRQYIFYLSKVEEDD